MPVYLKTDAGIISDGYISESVDFNVESLNYETPIRDKKENVMFEYDLFFGFGQQIYYRKNQEIYIFTTNFSGIINFLFIVGKAICYFSFETQINQYFIQQFRK